MKRLSCIAVLVFVLGDFARAVPVELGKEDVVAFVGGTDMVRMQKAGRLEAALTHRFMKVRPKFRDLAWDGDTVYFQSTIRERWRQGAFGDWKTQLKKVGATVVIAQFGKMESLDGPERLGDFVEGYTKLLDDFAADERRVVLLGPSPFEWPGTGGEAMQAYAGAIKKLADQRGLAYVAAGPGNPVEAFIRQLTGGGKVPENLVAAVREKHRLWYEYWRPANWKCLFGDDSRRIFSNAAQGLPSFKEEWSTYPGLIAQAEELIYANKPIKPRDPPVRTGSKEADVEKELAAFTVLEGFEVNLFADERHGVINPLSVRWDARGRMYVACSDVYPQIEPGVLPDDKVIIIEDNDHDGRADRSAVFADGLNIPTGMEVGFGKVYIGQGTEILELHDADGDGISESRKLLLSGFGNGDSHQTINSFAWSPGGELWFCQGDGIESRVETPFGVSSLFQAGVFRLRPHELQLAGLLDDFMGPGNPWGVAFDAFGQSLVIDGAGGVSYLTPGSIPAKRRLRLPRIGNPGGYCGIDCIEASNLPDKTQENFLIGDYKKNQVSRFSLVEDGAGFQVKWRKPFLRSTHRNFRPIDVKIGPDGAIYVVDWYNPITCHQDDFYRHPDRDKTHGRIWRVTPKAGAIKPVDLVSASTGELIEALGSTERWTRLKAKQVLGARDPKQVRSALDKWLDREAAISFSPPGKEEKNLLEAVMLMEWLNVPYEELLLALLGSSDYRGRAYAARVAGRWGMRLENAHDILEVAARDPHPRVRMEAVLACAEIPQARSVLIAASVAEGSRDRWIDYAFSQAVHHLKAHWMPAFRRGELDFGDRGKGLAAVLGQADSKALLAEVRKLLSSGEVDGEERKTLSRALVSAGGDDDVRFLLQGKSTHPDIIRALAERDRPGFDVTGPLREAMKSEIPAVRVAIMELVGSWKVEHFRKQVMSIASYGDGSNELSMAAVRALGSIGGNEAVPLLKHLVGLGEKASPAAVNDRPAVALAALLNIDPGQAAQSAAALLQKSKEERIIREVFMHFSAREGGTGLLVEQLDSLDVTSSQGELLRNTWIATGLVDPGLSGCIDKLTGVSAKGFQFSEKLLAELVAAARKGDRDQGKKLFESAQLGCIACHKAGEKGGQIGPDLTAVGSGVPFERIVTEVLWPARQVKEGFSLTRVTLKDKQVLQGYTRQSRSEEVLLLKDFATAKTRKIPREDIAKSEVIGSLMPPTAQGLSRKQIADLCAYLFGLSG
jgi:putative heme-binding domain-containing protein